MKRLTAALAAAALVSILAASSVTAKHQTTVITLPGATGAEGVVSGNGSTFYAGDLNLGDIYRGDVTPEGARVRVLPDDYVTDHVELAYASTAHGVQGDTVPAAHVVIGDATCAASAYVGMTRGRAGNTAHLVADSLDQAREQWITTFTHDRADLGPAHAANLAEIEAQRYARHRPLQTGRLGRHRRAVRQARDHLQQWADTWRPILPELPTDLRHTAASLAVSAGANVKAVQRSSGTTLRP